MSLGVFTLIRNEVPWVGYSVLAAKDLVDEWVFYDGNSTDGTLELLAYLGTKYHLNIRVFRGRDPQDFQDDYVRLFNECLGQLSTDYAWFLHPDMVVTQAPKALPDGPLAYSVEMRSVAGDPGMPLQEFESGRASAWKTIHKRTLGLHYFGHYGANNEDLYFRDITGDNHVLYRNLVNYPYEVAPSGISLVHFSDVRPYRRRRDRMIRCLMTQNKGMDHGAAMELAREHPRVSLEGGVSMFGTFRFKPFTDIPSVFSHAQEFAEVLGKPVSEVCWVPAEVAA